VSDDWNAPQCLKFEGERTRAARDLLAQIPLQRVRRAVDPGCGPGNSTELIVERFPEAVVSGLDSSEDMLRQARLRLPGCEFIEGDLTRWVPEADVDLLFSNAVYQWVPDHLSAMCGVLASLREGGVFAAQMPDNTREPSHVPMAEVAARMTEDAGGARDDLPAADVYYDALRPLCRRVEIWQTVYHHVMAGPAAIVEWFKGSALRPFLAGKDAAWADDFLRRYTEAVAREYPVRVDGTVLLRFPRLFIVAVR
jgi:trans-aconitate 2-methyltransferase